MGYCDRCGTWAALDGAAMCRACRDSWRPAGDRPGDLGYRVTGRDGKESADLLPLRPVARVIAVDGG